MKNFAFCESVLVRWLIDTNMYIAYNDPEEISYRKLVDNKYRYITTIKKI